MLENKEHQIRKVPNPHFLVWNVRARLIDSSIITFNSKDWEGVSTADDLGWLGRTIRFLLRLQGAHKRERAEEMRIKSFVNAFFLIPGVVSVTILQYSITIQKAEFFTWEEIIPRVEEILEVHLTLFG